MGRLTTTTKEQEDSILALKKQGLGNIRIARKLGLSNAVVLRVMYPASEQKRNDSMKKRYRLLRAKGLCHQCGQKLPTKSHPTSE